MKKGQNGTFLILTSHSNPVDGDSIYATRFLSFFFVFFLAQDSCFCFGKTDVSQLACIPNLAILKRKVPDSSVSSHYIRRRRLGILYPPT